MISIRKKNSGFTIIELLIVIIVIGILATLVIVTYNGIQQKARNTKRNTDINAIQGQVEAYFAQNGKYPTLANVNDSTWRSTNMKGLDPNALKDPNGSTQALVATTTANSYVYAVLPSDCNNAGTDCTGYTLTATLEGGGTYSKSALN
jgi:general secretion pathway protein G